MASASPPHQVLTLRALYQQVHNDNDAQSTIEVQPSSSTSRCDETRQTGSIVQATNYLENKIHNLSLDLNTRMDRIEDKLDTLIQNQQSRPPIGADQRRAARYPCNPLFNNNNTASTSPKPTPSTASRIEIKIKREDLRVFDPDAEDVKNSRVLMDGRCIVFTNVYSFELVDKTPAATANLLRSCNSVCYMDFEP